MQIEIFPYSVFYIFFEQYLNIWTVALTNLAIALGLLPVYPKTVFWIFC